ncbi:MAG: 4-amino-4-deoxy-L-arabinose transferase-like glycosyltransferase [Hyphomicrobiaceae bacterium]|jgi:4-amino-4-deoxy-L-arabinose transferase-like glycosyltransferase
MLVTLRRNLDPWLITILVVAAVVRAWGLGFGLPQPIARPDEATLVRIALQFGSGDLNPHFFNYPSLYAYVLAAVYGVVYGTGRLIGAYAGPADFARAADPTLLFMLARSLTAMAGVATVAVVAAIGRRIGGRRTGLVAAALLAVSFGHVRESHFGVTDTAATLMCALATYGLVRLSHAWIRRDVLITAAMGGLAMSTKYVGILFLPALAVVSATWATGLRDVPRRLIDRNLLLAIPVLLLAFLMGTPYALLDYTTFLEHLQFEANHATVGHLADVGFGFIRHATFSLRYGLGAPLLAAAVVGAVLLAFKRPRLAASLLVFPILYYASIGPAHTAFMRYALPLLPVLCVTAAGLITTLAVRLPQKSRTAVTILLVVAISGPSIARVAAFDQLLTRQDTRAIAGRWLIDELPAATTLCQPFPFARISLAASAPVGQTVDIAEISYDRDRDEFRQGQRRAGPPEFIVVPQSPLEAYDKIPAALAERLDHGYTLIKTFDGVGKEFAPYLFDQQDAFYVPVDDIAKIPRPGPDLLIYQRKTPADAQRD